MGPQPVIMTDALQTSVTVGDYDYVAGLAPTVTQVQPARGGTGGGTPITITGTGFTYDIDYSETSENQNQNCD